MADYQTVSERAVLSEADAVALQKTGVLSMDPERSLPLWFDGRFLTARDLNRQQNYLLSRHASLGRSMGSGVIEGLEVSTSDGGGTQARLRISAGQGVAFDGSHIHLPLDMELNFSDLAVQSALNAQLGLSSQPAAPLAARSGLFVLSLRAVEYTANQTPAFPTTVTGERKALMGDRIEAVAVTLTPFAPEEPVSDAAEARSRAAYRIFGASTLTGVPRYALPLAMLALRFGTVEWLDMPLVRRELVASKRDFLGLGLAEDQLRLAHFQQYRGALADLMRQYEQNGQAAKFPAEQHFRLLPPAGPLPAACVDPATQSQIFFPGEVETELSIIPEDELPALIEESFDLPPIDLTLPVADRDNLSVVILAPMPRHALGGQIQSLVELTQPLRPLSMLGQGPKKPLERLGAMRISLAEAAAQASQSDPVTAEWAAILNALTSFGLSGENGQRTLWYMRRRTLRRSADLESVLVAVASLGSDAADPGDPDLPVPAPDDTVDTGSRPVLSDTVRAALLRISGMGELARVASARLGQIPADDAEVFAAAIAETGLADDPLSVAALIARLRTPEEALDVKTLPDTVTALSKVDPDGMKLLSVGLLGRGAAQITAARFAELQPFLAPDVLLERMASALPRLPSAEVSDAVKTLSGLMQQGDTTGMFDFLLKIEDRAATSLQPASGGTVVVDTTAADAAAAEAARVDAAARLAAAAAAAAASEAALIASLTDRNDQTRLKNALAGLKPDESEAVVASLSGANVGSSRIATRVTLNALASGGAAGGTQIRQVAAIDAPFVTGLAALEPFLLADPTPSPSPRPSAPTSLTSTSATSISLSPVSLSPITRATLSPVAATLNLSAVRASAGATVANVLVNSAASVTDRRIALLAGASTLSSLAQFGAKNQDDPAALDKVSQAIIAATDASSASTVTVAKTIFAVVGGDA